MISVLYNISIILLSIGFIAMIIYITKIVTLNNYCPKTNDYSVIFDDRPSITYKKMFENQEVGFGYQDFDKNDNSKNTSFYTKFNK